MLTANESPAGFIRRTTRQWSPPLVPGMRLCLADESVEIWSQTEEALETAGLPPPFWAFAWAGGQALARFVRDNQAEVTGRSVLDFAAGSGIAGIAAAISGAGTVTATEIDAFAIAAIRLNAALNGVELDVRQEDVIGRDLGADVVLAGDVFYEDRLAGRAGLWLQQLHQRGARVLIGDPDRYFLPKSRLDCLAEYHVPVTRELEDREVQRARVWTFRN